MPLSFVSDGGVGPEVVCERVMEMVRRRLNAGESSTKSESVAFKVGCQINQHDSHGLIELHVMYVRTSSKHFINFQFTCNLFKS